MGLSLALALAGGAVLVPLPSTIQIGTQAQGFSQAKIRSAHTLATQAAVLRQSLSAMPAAAGRLSVDLRMDSRLSAGAYRIVSRPGEVEIVGQDAASVASGCATMTQLGASGSLPICTIEDHPDVMFRGLLVDVARQWHSIDTLKDIVVLCWLYKVDYLQLHLTDDQSFTFPTRAFPLLPTPGRTYTREQLRDLVAFARARGIAIIPEIEMPGHGAQMVSKMPDLFRAHALHHATLNFAKAEVREALKKLVKEVLEVFDPPFMHIGGDEADLAHVAETQSFVDAMKAKGLGNPQELFRDFINEMNQAVATKKRKMIVWEGFGPDGNVTVSKEIVVENFESAYYPPDQMAKAGYTMINASWKPLYVVNDRNWSPAEIYSWNYRKWEHFIEGFPSYKGIQLGPDAKVLGALMCAWEQPQEREIPSLRLRLPAMAERLWRAERRAPWVDFEARCAQTDKVLTLLLARSIGR